MRGKINLDLVGEIEFVNGQLVNKFDNLPDVPLSEFTLKINNDGNGLLSAAKDFCKRPNNITGQFNAHYNKSSKKTSIITGCKAITKYRISSLKSGKASLRIEAQDNQEVIKKVSITIPKGLVVSKKQLNKKNIKIISVNENKKSKLKKNIKIKKFKNRIIITSSRDFHSVNLLINSKVIKTNSKLRKQKKPKLIFRTILTTQNNNTQNKANVKNNTKNLKNTISPVKRP